MPVRPREAASIVRITPMVNVSREGTKGTGEPTEGVTGRASPFSAVEETKLAIFLRSSVGEQTHDGYANYWKIWKGFLWEWRGTADVALKEMETPLDKAKVVLLFMVYLYTVCDRREEEVTAVLSAVRHFLVTVHQQDVGFLSLEVMGKARQACRRSPDEVRDRQDAKEANTILPFCLEIVLALRDKLWTQTAWDHGGVLKKALWMGIGIGTDQGCRPSNLVQKDGKKAKDHTLRNSRVTFTLRDGETVEAGPAMSGVRAEDVVGVKVKLSTHKAGVDCSSGVHVGDGAGPDLVKDMAEWAVYWASRGPAQGDQHFCRVYRPSRGKKSMMLGKTITGKKLNAVIKEVCVQFHLPADAFSAKSMRKKMATDASLQGVSVTDMNSRGRWSNKANTGSQFYSHARATRGKGAGTGASEGLALAEVRCMATAKVTAQAKQAARGKVAKTAVRGPAKVKVAARGGVETKKKVKEPPTAEEQESQGREG